MALDWKMSNFILKKYSGDYAMSYKDGWFQFTGEIAFSRVS